MESAMVTVMENTEIVTNILRFTDCGADFKSFCLVSREWNSIINDLFPDGGDFVDHLKTIQVMLPHIKFKDEHEWLVINEAHYTWEYIQNHPNERWVMWQVCSNPNVTPEIVSSVPGFHIQGVLTPWDYKSLSHNPNFTWTVVKNIEGDWSYSIILRRKHTTFADFLEISAFYADAAAHFSAVYHKCYKTDKDEISEYVIQHPKLGWDFPNLLECEVLDWDFFLDNHKLFISRNTNVITLMHNTPWDVVLNNRHIPWDYDALCSVVPYFVIESFPGVFNNTRYISSNPQLTWKIITREPDTPWFSKRVYKNFHNKYRKYQEARKFYKLKKLIGFW